MLTPPPGPLLSVRAALVLLIAAIGTLWAPQVPAAAMTWLRRHQWRLGP